ncbi:LicD family protein [Vibrio agarivorans]|uniref:LicD family protein n=1 Tax=Vibrio agarivorans TaxID=153622 RepID=UPI0025B5E767|nr:LicD family protein [Vibrio agarivorans]MDN3662168.1 LicD family protein [Vibrio agarivorans]
MEYNNYDINEVHSKLTEMLKELLDFFDKENIRYVAIGGTALGAYRHSGYIPWDDDVDLAIPRDDYERMIKLAPKFPKSLFLQNYLTDSGFHLFFSKVRLNNTTFVEERFEHSEMHQGLFIDILPMDKNTTKADDKAVFDITNAFSRRVKPYPGLLGSLRKTIYTLVYPHPLKTYQKVNECMAKYNDQKPVSWSTMGHEDSFLEEDIFPAKELDFDGLKLKVPKNIIGYLSSKYGPNYMTPPPVEKRTPPHKIIEVDLTQGLR